MDNEEILKLFEKQNNLKVLNVTPISPNKKQKGDWLQNIWKIDASDGKKYVYKYLHLNDKRYKEYIKIQAMNIDFLPKLLFIHQIKENKYAIVVEWVEGVTLQHAYKKNMLKYFFATGKIVELIKKLHAVKIDAELISVSESDIDNILNRDFLDQELKQTLRKYMVERLDIVNGRRMCIIHGDIHSRNIIMTQEGLRLIDLDDIRFGDAYMDLIFMANNIVPATTFDKIYKFFFLQKFFDGNVPEDFWEVVNFYSIIKNIFRMNDEIKNRADHRAFNTFPIMFKEHKNMTVCKPDWYIRMERIFLWAKRK